MKYPVTPVHLVWMVLHFIQYLQWNLLHRILNKPANFIVVENRNIKKFLLHFVSITVTNRMFNNKNVFFNWKHHGASWKNFTYASITMRTRLDACATTASLQQLLLNCTHAKHRIFLTKTKQITYGNNVANSSNLVQNDFLISMYITFANVIIFLWYIWQFKLYLVLSA